MIKACPHCHLESQGFFINGIMRGSVQSFYDEDGDYEELNLDRAYWEQESNSVRCANCGKIRRDVEIINRTKIAEKQIK